MLNRIAVVTRLPEPRRRNLSRDCRYHRMIAVYVSDMASTITRYLEFEELRQIVAGALWRFGIFAYGQVAIIAIAELATLPATHVEEAVGFCPAS